MFFFLLVPAVAQDDRIESVEISSRRVFLFLQADQLLLCQLFFGEHFKHSPVDGSLDVVLIVVPGLEICRTGRRMYGLMEVYVVVVLGYTGLLSLSR